MLRRNFLFSACAAFLSSTAACQSLALNDVSLIALIANPKAYDGKRIRVIGFLRLEFEGDSLFVSKSDYDAAITKNAVWVSVPAKISVEGLSDHYALIEGTFDAKMTGHMGMNSGSIRDITRLQRWPSRSEFDAEAKRGSSSSPLPNASLPP